MTSVLNVDTIAAKNGTSPVTLTKQSAVKGFVYYDMASTSALKSFNFSSITDNAVGGHTVTMATAMDSINYATTAGCGRMDSGTYGFLETQKNVEAAILPNTTTAYQYIVVRHDAGAYMDADRVNFAVHGDLA